MQAVEERILGVRARFGNASNTRIELFLRNQLSPKTALANIAVLETFQKRPFQCAAAALDALSKLAPKARTRTLTRVNPDFGVITFDQRSSFIASVMEEFPEADISALFEASKRFSTPIGFIPVQPFRTKEIIEECITWQELLQRFDDEMFGSASNTFDVIGGLSASEGALVRGQFPGLPALIRDGKRIPLPVFLKRPAEGGYLKLEMRCGEEDE
jgi:hypothetical protein